MEDLADQIREDYLISVKKSIVDFVLREQKDLQLVVDENQVKAPIYPPKNPVFVRNYNVAKEFCYTNLHPYNKPLQQELLKMWHVKFGDLRMLSVSSFEQKTEAIELSDFNKEVLHHTANAEDRLQRRWLPEVQNMFHAHNKKYQATSSLKGLRLQAFFNSTAQLMTQNLQDMTLASIEEYKGMIVNMSSLNSGLAFIIRLVLDGDEVKFEPDVTDFFEYCTALVDVVKNSAHVVPRVESKLFTELPWSKPANSDGKLHPTILESITSSAKDEIIAALKVGAREPQAYLAKVEKKYKDLITRKSENDLNAFLAGEHPFRAFQKQIKQSRGVLNLLQYDEPKIVKMGMFELHVDELIRSLMKRVNSMITKTIDQMKTEHVTNTKNLVQRFEEIATTALTTPKDTAELMDLSQNIQAIRKPGGEMSQIEKQLRATKERLLFLAAESPMMQMDYRLNTDALSWPERIEKIFTDHENIVKEKTMQYQDGLKQRRERFILDLESYSKTLDEFSSFSDPDDVEKYYQKAQRLQGKLDAALEKIDQFNVEEESYGWETSVYPIRGEISNKLAPYYRLYEACSKFKSEKNEIVNGDMSKVNPDDVEANVDNYWRTLYKCEKEMKENPVAKNIATSIKSDVDDFKKSIPIIQTVCNPGERFLLSSGKDSSFSFLILLLAPCLFTVHS